ncbi:MAG: ABC transporter permease [Dehalococcoidia bacterium]
MNLNLYLLNIKVSRVALLGWSLFLGAYAVLVVYLYPSIDDATDLVEHLRELPLQVKSAIGLDQETIEEAFPGGEFSFYGALATQYLIWWPVFVSIYAVLFGSGAITGDVERGIASILMAQPFRRYKLVMSKSLAFVSILLALGTISWGAVMATVVVMDIDVSIANVTVAHAVGLFLVLAVFSYSLLISSLFTRTRSALGVAALLTFVFYMLNFMSPSFGDIGWLENGSLFHFYQPLDLLTDVAVNWAGIAVYGGIVLGSHLVSIIVFQRRDIAG